ncbi:MAG: formate/nitrite transporter family protein [Planctomycetes bacterium]|nr:formate/nitrite transporter family protein [Planctomycetota bacterium]HPF12909.1 formate/nitrite transporter family protein [Planctomycetota bacterium]
METHNPTGLDAYKSSEITRLAESAGVAKAQLPWSQMLTLAILAGVFIALGGAAYTMVMSGASASFGPARLLGGVVFSLGLILVVVGGAELFTGNALMVMAVVDKRISIGKLLRNWSVVYLGNAIGSVAVAFLMGWTGQLHGGMQSTAVQIATAKVGLSIPEALTRGILCNMLVCLAVWLTLAARSVTDKILAILWPVSAFVLLGFEHSVANMYLLPQGALAGADLAWSGALGNLLWVTLGNILGGAVGVALVYRFAYGPPKA